MIMECKYVHVQSELKNVCLRQNIHLFMTFALNRCIVQKFVGISLVIH